MNPQIGRPLTIAHDYFTQRGGAERVAAELIRTVMPDRAITAVHNPDKTFPLPITVPIETSLLQLVPLVRNDPRFALLLFPIAWRVRRPVHEGVLLCSSSGWSHLLRTTGSAVKVVYCHNPPRWLYQSEHYLMDRTRAVRLIMRITKPLLKAIDRRAARSAHVYIANSTAVAARVKSAYGIEATVIPPPISIDPSAAQAPVAVPWDQFFLTVGRSRGYKNTHLLIEAFQGMPDRNLVVVGQIDGMSLPENIHTVTDASDAEMRWLYAHATALVSVAHEDFGLTPLEANMFGTPTLLLRAGGFLDSLHEGVSGEFIDDTDPVSIQQAVRGFSTVWDRSRIRRHAEQFSLDRFISRLLLTAGGAPSVGVAESASPPTSAWAPVGSGLRRGRRTST